VDQDNTIVVAGAGSRKATEGRMMPLRAQIEEATSDYDREKLQERLAKLAAAWLAARSQGCGQSDSGVRGQIGIDIIKRACRGVGASDCRQRRL
jgi:chaperonin GroEL (HSP60 family)